MMEALVAALLLLVGLSVGATEAWWLRGRELAAERTASAAAEALRREGYEREIAVLTAMRGEIEGKMQTLAGAALKDNQASFLNLANEVFAKHREGAAATLEARQKEMAALLAPL